MKNRPPCGDFANLARKKKGGGGDRENVYRGEGVLNWYSSPD